MSCHGARRFQCQCSLAASDSEHSSVVVNMCTCDYSNGPAQKSPKLISLKVLKLENLKAWTAYTIGVLYGCIPASGSWGCNDIGLVLPIDGGIVAFSIVS